MGHRKLTKSNRDIKYRKALHKNLVNNLILLEEIKTTFPRAKSIAQIVEKLITKAKAKTIPNQRLITAFLQNKKTTKKIIDELGPRYEQRPGGFTRIIRLSERRGDAAQMAKIELVDKKTKDEEVKKIKPPKPELKKS